MPQLRPPLPILGRAGPGGTKRTYFAGRFKHRLTAKDQFRAVGASGAIEDRRVNAPFSESAREAGDVSEGTCWGVRAKCADRLASQYADGKLGLAERPEAEQALRLLRYDGETWV